MQPISFHLGENDEFCYNEKNEDKNSKFISFNLFYQLKIREIPALFEFSAVNFCCAFESNHKNLRHAKVEPTCEIVLHRLSKFRWKRFPIWAKQRPPPSVQRTYITHLLDHFFRCGFLLKYHQNENVFVPLLTFHKTVFISGKTEPLVQIDCWIRPILQIMSFWLEKRNRDLSFLLKSSHLFKNLFLNLKKGAIS